MNISAKLTQLDNAAIRRLRLLSDDELRAECDVQAFRGSGPGGQKRNKTSSAVRIVHRSSGLSATATVDRSQERNLASAMKRLRLEIAFKLRCEPVPFSPTFPTAHVLLHAEVGEAFDWLDRYDWSLRDAAGAMNVSTAALSRWLTEDPALLAEANRCRAACGLGRLNPRD